MKKKEINDILGENFLIGIYFSPRSGSGRLPFEKAVFSNGKSINISEFGKFYRLFKSGKYDEARAFIMDYEQYKLLNAARRKAAAAAGGKAAMQNPNNQIQNRQFTHWNKGTVGKVKAWNQGLTKDTDRRCENISKAKTGNKNPMFGREVSEKTRLKLSEKTKANILSGKWTPNTFNSRTRKQLLFRGKLFRSSWEVLFHQAFPEMKYEQLRIPYTTDKPHVYITDFVYDKIIYEIKPQKMIEQKIEILNLIKSWSSNNGYEFKIINEFDLTNLIPECSVDFKEFDKSTEKLLRGLYASVKKRRNKTTRQSL